MSKINLNPGDSIVTKNQNGMKGIPVDARTQVQYYKDIQNIEYAYENLQVTVANDDPTDSQHPKGIYVITVLDELGSVVSSGIKTLKEFQNLTKQDVGLENVNNTSDLDKPISTAVQEALSSKQNTISDLTEIRNGAQAGASAIQPVSGATEGNIVIFKANGGLADSQKKIADFATSEQGEKADNAIPMPTGTDGQILEKDSNETSGVKWVNKPSDGKSAYQLYVDGGGTLTQEQWLASLKANIGAFLFVPTDAAAVTAMATIGQTYSSAIDPQGKNVSPSQDTLSVILLMNDDATTPTKTMMIATQEVTPATTPASYEFIYAGDLQSAMPSNVLTEDDIVDNHTSTSTTNALSANQGKVLYELIDANSHSIFDLENAFGSLVVDNLTTDDATKALSAKQGKELKTELDNKTIINYQFSNSGGIAYNGVFNASSSYVHSDYIEIYGGEEINGYGTIDYSTVVFYDMNKTFISALTPTSQAMNHIVLTPSNIPSGAVYFIAGTLVSKLSESYIKQQRLNSIDNLPTTSFDLWKEQTEKVDGVISYRSFTITNSKIQVDVNFPYTSAYIMLECANPPSSTFKIGRRQKYNTTVSTYLTDCSYNTWIRVDSDETKNIFYLYNDNTSSSVSIPARVLYKKIGISIEDRLNELNNGLKFSTNQVLNTVGIVNNFLDGGVNNVLSAEKGKELNVQINGVYEYQDDMEGMLTGRYYNTSDTMTGEDLPRTDTNCIKLSCSNGDTFRVYGKGASTALRQWAFVNGSGTQLTHANTHTNSRTNGVIITAPENSVYLYINFFEYDSTTDKVQRLVQVQEGLADRVSDLESSVSSYKPLEGKKIVCFGDSITEFKDSQAKSWTNYASEITGAEFVNVGIGGSQIRQRAAYSNPNKTIANGAITVFDETVSYNVGDWVYYKPSTSMNVYTCTTAHTGTWNDSDFTEISSSDYYYAYSPLDIVSMITAVCGDATNVDEKYKNQIAAAECVNTHSGDNNTEIINRLKNIDWATVDMIFIMAGTNDFNGMNLGTSGSTNPNTTLGAINAIVSTFCSKYKNIKVFYCNPIVRWFNYSGGTGVDTDWCDVYTGSGSMTCKEFGESLLNEFVLNHITTKNIYSSMGWNKYNFSNYFNSNDGTHPYKGFRQLGQTISSFIVSEKNW